MKLQKKFKIDEAAYVEFIKKTMGARNYLSVIISAFIIVVIAVAMKFGETYAKSLLIGALYAAIYAVVVLVFTQLTTVGNAKKMYAKNNFVKYKILLTFDDRGLVQQIQKDKDFVVRWSEFVKIRETKLSFIFYVNKKQAVLACKSGLEAAEVAKLREIIYENGTKNGLKLKLLPREEELAAQLPDEYVADEFDAISEVVVDNENNNATDVKTEKENRNDEKGEIIDAEVVEKSSVKEDRDRDNQ